MGCLYIYVGFLMRLVAFILSTVIVHSLPGMKGSSCAFSSLAMVIIVIPFEQI